MTHNANGALIAAMGISGCGKSSVFQELSRLLGVPVFHCAEEAEWPSAVLDRQVSGSFGALMWWRSYRVPLLHYADRMRSAGGTVLFDSYYDKLLCQYLGKPGMEWLIAPDDPYFPVMQAACELDWTHLPNCDTLVLFDVAEADWHCFLDRRARSLDADPGFRASYYTQNHFVEAASTYCDRTGAQLVVFKQEMSSTHEAACRLRDQLVCEGALLGFGEA